MTSVAFGMRLHIALGALLAMAGLWCDAVRASEPNGTLQAVNRAAVFLDADDRAEFLELRQSNNWSFHVLRIANDDGGFSRARFDDDGEIARFPHATGSPSCAPYGCVFRLACVVTATGRALEFIDLQPERDEPYDRFGSPALVQTTRRYRLDATALVLVDETVRRYAGPDDPGVAALRARPVLDVGDCAMPAAPQRR